MADSFDIDADATELRDALREASGGLAAAVRGELTDRARMIARAASGRVPRRTGAAAATVDAVPAPDGAQIVAGGRRAPYFPWLEFGGDVGRRGSIRRPFVRDGRYIGRAVDASLGDLEAAVARAVFDTARQAGLEVTPGGA